MNIIINYSGSEDDIMEVFLPIIDEVLKDNKVNFENKAKL